MSICDALSGAKQLENNGYLVTDIALIILNETQMKIRFWAYTIMGHKQNFNHWAKINQSDQI